MNKSDSERIAAVLEKRGYKSTTRQDWQGYKSAPRQDWKMADLIVVNMCSVRQSAVDRVYGLIPKFRKLKQEKPKVKTILTGCILKKDRKKFKEQFDLILDIKTLVNWPESLNKITNKITNSALFLGTEKNYLSIKPKRKSSLSALVAISNGCNNFCTYCAVPFTRGKLICREHKKILEEVKNATKKGAREIWLLGQNVNDYTSPIDNSINFPKLLKMINNIPGNFRIRFMSPNPKNFSDKLIDVMAESKKIAKYLNLPVQSGDNKILKKMNRPYTVEQYKNLVKKIRKKIPDINLSTDVIVGFPGETRKQFENTAKLFKQIKFNVAYISKYSPRPETSAFQIKDNVPIKEKKTREKILINLLKKNDV